MKTQTYNQSKDLKVIAAEISRQYAAGECRQFIGEHRIFNPRGDDTIIPNVARVEFTLGNFRARCDDTPEAVLKLVQRYDKSAGKPAKNVLSDAFKWCAKACAKKDTREYLNYVYVTESQMIGCNGHTVHMAPAEHREPGFYTTKGDLATPDPRLKFPDLARIVPDPANCSPVCLADRVYGEAIEKGTIEPVTLTNGATFNKKYLANALAGLPGAVAIQADKLSPLRIDCAKTGRMAVIMGLRV